MRHFPPPPIPRADRSIVGKGLAYAIRVFGGFWTIWPFKIFLLYVALILVFGASYAVLYRNNPQRFVFQSEILKTKNAERKGEIQTDINTTKTRLDALSILKDGLANTQQIPASHNSMGWDSVTFCFDRYRFDFDLNPVYGQRQLGENQLWITVPSNPDQDILSAEFFRVPVRYETPFPIDAYKEMAEVLNQRFQGRLTDEDRELASISDTTPQHWSYWDFVYFSAMTQSTVGYGDILPNSTLVRTTVTFQVVLGVFLFVVVVNLAAKDVGKAIRGQLPEKSNDESR